MTRFFFFFFFDIGRGKKTHLHYLEKSFFFILYCSKISHRYVNVLLLLVDRKEQKKKVALSLPLCFITSTFFTLLTKNFFLLSLYIDFVTLSKKKELRPYHESSREEREKKNVHLSSFVVISSPQQDEKISDYFLPLSMH